VLFFGVDALHRLKVSPHPLRVRVNSGKEAEGSNRLKNSHAAAAHRTAAQGTGSSEQLRLKGEVDDICHPEGRVQKVRRQRHAGKLGHSERRRVDNTVGRGDSFIQSALERRCSANAEQVAEFACKPLRTDRVSVDDNKFLSFKLQQSMRNGSTCSTSPELHNVISGDVR
jgi:hypothetical protein